MKRHADLAETLPAANMLHLATARSQFAFRCEIRGGDLNVEETGRWGHGLGRVPSGQAILSTADEG